MSFIHICPNCKGVFKYPSIDVRDCPECRINLIPTDFSDTEWAELSPAEKNDIRSELFNENERMVLEEEKKQLRQKNEELDRLKEAKKNGLLDNMIVSSSSCLEGYSIVQYKGFITSDSVFVIHRDEVYKEEGKILETALAESRKQAVIKLKEISARMGCNAIIDVKVDTTTFDQKSLNHMANRIEIGPYVVCVTVQGNAAIVEKKGNFQL